MSKVKIVKILFLVSLVVLLVGQYNPKMLPVSLLDFTIIGFIVSGSLALAIRYLEVKNRVRKGYLFRSKSRK